MSEQRCGGVGWSDLMHHTCHQPLAPPPHSLLRAHEVPRCDAQGRHDAAKQQDQQDEGRRLLVLGKEPLGQGDRHWEQIRKGRRTGTVKAVWLLVVVLACGTISTRTLQHWTKPWRPCASNTTGPRTAHGLRAVWVAVLFVVLLANFVGQRLVGLHSTAKLVHITEVSLPLKPVWPGESVQRKVCSF